MTFFSGGHPPRGPDLSGDERGAAGDPPGHDAKPHGDPRVDLGEAEGKSQRAA